MVGETLFLPSVRDSHVFFIVLTKKRWLMVSKNTYEESDKYRNSLFDLKCEHPNISSTFNATRLCIVLCSMAKIIAIAPKQSSTELLRLIC